MEHREYMEHRKPVLGLGHGSSGGGGCWPLFLVLSPYEPKYWVFCWSLEEKINLLYSILQLVLT